MNESIFYICFGVVVVAFLSRDVSVRLLRKSNPELWRKLGSPNLMERDARMLKFPYRGWISVFRVSSIALRVVLLVFIASNLLAVPAILLVLLRTCSASA